MAKKVLIVESPGKIKTISKFLGTDFMVVSTVGHIKDLPPKSLGVTMTDSAITLEYVTLDKKDKVIKDICKAAKGAETIFLAPDPDREGELIAWHVAQELEKVVDTDSIKRITFNEITKSAITDAIKHPGKVDLHKVEAQQARRVVDRWVGYEVSPILWKKFRKALSAGRVQTVALRLICEREEAIRTFKPEESWSIEAQGLIKDHAIILTLTHIKKKKINITQEEQAKATAEQLRSAQLVVTSVVDSKRTKKPAAPFITSTLQQAASQQLSFKVARTMELAQKLYEGIAIGDDQTPVALITYMRTDSTRIAESAVKATRAFIKGKFGDEYLPGKAPVYGGKKGQDAHEAIRPIDVTLTPDQLAGSIDPALHKLYSLIWKRFVACQMSDAQYAQRKVVVEGDGFTLSATGSTLLFDGFLKLYTAPEDEEEASSLLPDIIKEQMPVPLKSVTPKQHFTQPPARFSEASLIKELEKAGIGRPSTYATILKTIQARSYTELDTKKRFVPTDLGMLVTKVLVENLPKIMSTSFTAEMETDLDKIAHGDLNRDKLLRDFYAMFSKDLSSFRTKMGTMPLEVTNLTCPECKKDKLVVRFGKAGPFVGCAGYPECTFTSNFERTPEGEIKLVEAQKPAILNEKCPNCSKPLRQVVGKFGAFVACSGYPECKYIKQKIAPFPCPQCGGEVAQRNWRGKIFWGCKSYPTCKFSISGDISEKPCPQCSSPYLRIKHTKDGGTSLVCPHKECDYTEEQN